MKIDKVFVRWSESVVIRAAFKKKPTDEKHDINEFMDVCRYETLCAFAACETKKGYLKTLIDLHFVNGQVITGFHHDVDPDNFLINLGGRA